MPAGRIRGMRNKLLPAHPAVTIPLILILILAAAQKLTQGAIDGRIEPELRNPPPPSRKTGLPLPGHDPRAVSGNPYCPLIFSPASFSRRYSVSPHHLRRGPPPPQTNPKENACPGATTSTRS